MSWITNSIMEWSVDGGITWTSISDHGRSTLQVDFEPIETKQRTADGTMRRYTVARKRTWSASWENLPDKATTFLANGQPGRWMENFYLQNTGMFLMRIRSGSDIDATIAGATGEVYKVMLSSFSKEIIKRGKQFDLWSVDITLEEV